MSSPADVQIESRDRWSPDSRLRRRTSADYSGGESQSRTRSMEIGSNPHRTQEHQASTVRRPSIGNESCVSGISDMTGVTHASASDATPEGRAVRAYLKQPLQLRATIEAWEIPVEDTTDRMPANNQGEGIEKARWRNMDVAVKTVRGSSTSDAQMVKQEIEVLTRNRHPNLVMFLGACTTSDPIQVVIEYMPLGSIDLYYADQKQRGGGKAWLPSRTQLLAWSTDLFRALCFLHMSKPPVIHMDLVPSNLLLSSNLTLKVSGFGLSRSSKRKRTGTGTGAMGTDLRFVSPEVLLDRHVTDKADVYSAGMVMFFLATGEMPFRDHPSVVDKLVQEANVPRGVTVTRPHLKSVKWEDYASTVEDCWQHDPSDRPSSSDMVDVMDRMSAAKEGIACGPPSCAVS